MSGGGPVLSSSMWLIVVEVSEDGKSSETIARFADCCILPRGVEALTAGVTVYIANGLQ